MAELKKEPDVPDELGDLHLTQAEMENEDAASLRERSEALSVGEIDAPFEDGFTMKTFIGALFVGLIMAPGAIYLGLVAGSGLGGAAQWVTIVLFAEVARRSFLPLKRQEIFMLYYVAGGLASVALADRGISGGPFAELIWRQYFIQSPQAATIANEIPRWATPGPGSDALTHRTFLHGDWTIPIVVIIATQILERLSWIPAGYMLFRLTSDIERLPFPLAAVAASGATALAEASTKEESWRWRIFSTGTTIGLVFGAFYVAIPVFTSVVFGKALMLIPIPFVDLMGSTETILPAAPFGFSGDLGKVLTGFVLPFSLTSASFIASIIGQLVMNPIMYKAGILTQWKPAMDSINTKIVNDFDFWLSVGIGIQIAIAFIGIVIVVTSSIEAARGIKNRNRGSWTDVPKGRGDNLHTVKLAFVLWLAATIGYVWFTHTLLPTFPTLLLCVYAFVWTPFNSFVSARMFGLTSTGVSFPYLDKLTIMKSGYSGIDVWYAPMPLHDYGSLAQRFREVELTRTSFTSIVKAEAVMLPMILIVGFLYWQFVWHSTPIPSSQFPFAQKVWPIHATQQAIWNQINKQGGANWVLTAIKPNLIAYGGIGTLITYGLMTAFKLPVLAFYGAAGGINAYPHDTIPTFIGACLGKWYFSKRIGVEKWTAYAPVLLAGFSCGTGLISMASIALALISKAVQPLPF